MDLKEGCLHGMGDLTKVSERDITAATGIDNNKDKALEIVKNQSRVIDGNSDKYLNSMFEVI